MGTKALTTLLIRFNKTVKRLFAKVVAIVGNLFQRHKKFFVVL